MKIPPEIQQQILEVRRNNPQLTANMSDEDIVLLLMQADLTLEHGKPMTFIVQRSGEAQESAGAPDLFTLSVHECGAYGEQLLAAGRWFEAERYFLAQLEKGKEEASLDQQAIAYSLLGTLYCFRGNMDQAMMLYNHALSLAEQVHNLHLVGMIYNDVGEVYRKQGDYPQAIVYYSKSLEIAANMGNEENLAVVYGNLGIVHKNQGQFEQAVQAYEKSLVYSIRQGIDRLTANQYGNLGVVYGLEGRYAEAIAMHEKSLEICLRLGEQKGSPMPMAILV